MVDLSIVMYIHFILIYLCNEYITINVYQAGYSKQHIYSNLDISFGTPTSKVSKDPPNGLNDRCHVSRRCTLPGSAVPQLGSGETVTTCSISRNISYQKYQQQKHKKYRKTTWRSSNGNWVYHRKNITLFAVDHQTFSIWKDQPQKT